ncbi:MAG: conjugal transfer protein TraB [Desulfobacterales bacterium]|nr:conjugal transfer protein TraB [Desulfobacterales bacterium]
MDEQILRTTKEIIVKFIEMGRLSPSNIHETFKDIHATVNETVKKNIEPPSNDKSTSGPNKS